MKIWVAVGRGKEFSVEVPDGLTLDDLSRVSSVNASSKVYDAKADEMLIPFKTWNDTKLHDGQHVRFVWASRR